MDGGLRTPSFCDTEICALQNWDEEEKKNVCLTIWVDSKSMRVALCPTKEPKKTIYMLSIPVSKADDVIYNFENLRSAFALYQCSVVFATMSFAGPVSPDHLVITNWQCEARERVIHFTSLPFDLFPLDRRRFMNDLEAASYGIIAKSINNILPNIFLPLWSNNENSNITLDGTSLVISIGSGFGTSFICRVDASDHNCVVSSEAGHAQAYCCDFRDPFYLEETKFFKYASQKLHGGSHQPEWEDFCAIRGLELAYQFLKFEKNQKIDKNCNYQKIRSLAISNEDPDALIAFKLHYRFVIRAVQSMVLAIKSQRVFLISENQVKNLPIVQKIALELKDSFINHPRSNWLKKIQIFVQKSDSTFALSGGLFLSRVFATAHLKQSHSE